MNYLNVCQLETYSKEQLDQIKELAGYLLEPEQIALQLDIDFSVFRDHLRMKSHPAYLSYAKGKLATILELRKQEIDLAKLGSPMAISLVAEYVIKQKQGEKK